MKKVSEQDVLQTIQKALDLKNQKITAGSTMQNVERWDSLGHLSVLTSLDQLFEGRVAPIREIAGADSVEKILTILRTNELL